MINIMHTVCLVAALLSTFLLMGFTFGVNSDRSQFHMVNTYLSHYSASNVYATYLPVSYPVNESFISVNTYKCLMQAEVAVTDAYKCKADNIDNYIVCLEALSNTNYKYNSTINNIKKILGEYRGPAYEFSQLPNIFTSDPSLNGVYAILPNNNARTTLKNDLYLLSTPLSTNILDSITRMEKGRRVSSCIASSMSQSTQISSVNRNISVNVNSIYDYLWQCVSDIIYTEPVQESAFKKCTAQSAWPGKDVLQNSYSLNLMSSFNSCFLTVVANWLLCSFLVYTFWGKESASTVNGKPAEFFARAGKFFVLFGFVWNVGCVLMVFIQSFKSVDYWPMSIQTVGLALFFSITSCIYFGRELYELLYLAHEKGVQLFEMKGQAMNSKSYQLKPMQGFMRINEQIQNLQLKSEQYLPLIAPVWSDAFIFVDGLLFLGVLGTVVDVVTVDVVICTLSLVLIAVVNSVLVRMIYEGYICEMPESLTFPGQGLSQSTMFEEYKYRTYDRKKLKDSSVAPEQACILAIRVMVMLTNIIGIILQIVVLYLCIKRFGFGSTASLYVFFSSTIPQLLWLALTFSLDFQLITKVENIYGFVSVIFLINTIVRTSFIYTIIANVDVEFKKTIENDDSLNNLFQSLGALGERRGEITMYI